MSSKLFLYSRQSKTEVRHSPIHRSKTHGAQNGCLCPAVVLLQCGWGTEPNYAGRAPHRRPGVGRAQWLFCSDGIFACRRAIVTRPAAGGEGNARARVVEALLGDLHRVVSGVQLGITLTSLALGALGEATFAKNDSGDLAQRFGAHTALFAHAIALACAFALLSALHVVIGELVPRRSV